MDKIGFKSLILKDIAEGMIFDNPGGGTSTIMSIDNERIVYKRGGSRFYLKLDDFYEVFERFYRKKCSTNDIKEFNPQVFRSGGGGHGCHCTFMFIILNHIRFTKNGICGTGKPGNPFYIEII